MTKKKMTKQVQIKTTEEKHKRLSDLADKGGMTKKGVINFALRKIFNIDL